MINNLTTMLVFPGQGSQILNMGKDFFDNFAIAKNIYQEADDILGYKLSSIIFGENYHTLCMTKHAQPAIMITSIAILEVLLHEIGRPINKLCNIVAGHSLGEYSALCAAKTFSISDAVNVLSIRGNAMNDAAPNGIGGMVAFLGSTLEQASAVIGASRLPNEILVIANDNTIGQIVISGHMKSIDRAISKARDFNIKRAVKLPVSGPFHSPIMHAAANVLADALEQTQMHAPCVSFLSNVSANCVTEAKAIKQLLIKQVVSNVRWRDIVEHAASLGVTSTIEIGSGKILSSLIKRINDNIITYSISTLDEMLKFIEILDAN